MNVSFVESHPQRVLEAFRRGDFDELEVIGQADEKEFFELCFQKKMLGVTGRVDAHGPQKGGGAPLVYPGGQSLAQTPRRKLLSGL